MATKKKETVKTESKHFNEYELVFIINPEVAEEAIETTINGIKQFITGRDGTISNADQWGKRKLAYPIKHFSEGNYVLIQFKMNAKWSKELEANLQISEQILRHLLIKLNG